ncbi:MAG TPA: class I SAM-dependent methyltransferase [Gemmatimonadaceae bacterium]|nr:class I SAM-dependent methyltransferase [Gemmatimonadaceae bacterium]
MPDDTAPVYTLGHGERELRRLAMQAEYWGDFTLDVLRRAGLGAGMRVLDLGSGAGDVSMLAASLVGPGGHVLGVDRSPESVERAALRASASELANVEFIAADIGSFDPPGTYDAIIGRYVLMYFADPAAVLSRLTRSVRPGGIVAFMEADLVSARSVPPVSLIDDTLDLVRETFRRAGAALDLGPRLWRVFRAVGVERPEIVVGARADPAPAEAATELLAETTRSLLIMMERLGVRAAADMEIDTLAERFRGALLDHQATLILPNVVGTYGRLSQR